MRIMIDVEEPLMEKVLAECTLRGITLDSFASLAFKLPLMQSNAASSLLPKLVASARALPSGSEFHLAKLCPASDWRAIGAGERKSLGKGFRKEVEGATPPIARHIGRTSNSQAIYQRV